jgi:glycosyltransferase involved in cell wall biosynthesis
VKDLKITNVKFFGLVPHNELIQLYFRADVCVVPSVWDEPLGLVVLEAMAAKTPVVVTRKGGISLMVKDGINGLFVRPRNAREIAEKVNLLLKNDQLRLKIAQKARQTVLDKFTWNKIANLYEEIYFKNIKVTI